MTVISSRDGERVPRVVRRVRAALALLLLGGLLLVTGCGMDAQTTQPYTPAEGVNFDVGDQSVPDSVVHVRNLLIISRGTGTSIVSASMVAVGTDSLVGISGAPFTASGALGTPFTATLPSRILLTGNKLEVLTNQNPLITIPAQLTPGLDAQVTVQFAKAGSYTTRVPVVDGTVAPYTSITPQPSATSSPSASPSA